MQSPKDIKGHFPPQAQPGHPAAVWQEIQALYTARSRQEYLAFVSPNRSV